MTRDIVGSGWVFPPQVSKTRGGWTLTSARNEIDQAMRIILLTPIGQRVMRPTFGCRIHELIFAPNNAQTAARARRYVEEALGMWEPRIIVNEVIVTVHPKHANELQIEVRYIIKSTNDPRSLVFPFYLIPEE